MTMTINDYDTGAGSTPAPGRPGEFRGLSDVVEVWQAASAVQRADVFHALYEILDRADGYMREIEQQEAVNEVAVGHRVPRTPMDDAAQRACCITGYITWGDQHTAGCREAAPADDREPAHTVEILDDMLRVATGQYQQMPAEMFGPGDWLNVAAYFAADAVTEKTALTEANGVGAAAIIARNNCAAATGLADMFAHLAVAACAVEGVRRGR